MTVKAGGILVALVVVGVLAFGLWYQSRYPRTIVATGSVRVESPSRSTYVLKTRTIEINGRRFQEVELPNGTWIDCAGDCRKAGLEAGPEFWEALRRKQ